MKGEVYVRLLFLLLIGPALSTKWDGAAKFHVLSDDGLSVENTVCGICDGDSAAPPYTGLNVKVVRSDPVSGDCGSTKVPTMNASVEASGNGVYFQRLNCTFQGLSQLAESRGALAIVIGNKNDTSLIMPFANESSIPVCMVSPSDAALVQSRNVSLLRLKQPSPHRGIAVLLILMATCCVVAGGIWATQDERRPRQNSAGGLPTDHEQTDKEEEPALTLRMVVIFICCASLFLILLNFFYDYLVYLLFVIFAVFGAFGVFTVITSWTPHAWKTLHVTLPYIGRTDMVSIFIAIFSFSLGVWWLFKRNSSYGWVLQDLLGCCFLTTAISSLKVNSLKIATIFLMALLVYDVFFVFITPLFTRNGSSVMVNAARGSPDKKGCYNNMLPFLLKVPRGVQTECAPCPTDMALGFGDIVLPAILVGFCMRFDYFIQPQTYNQQGFLAFFKWHIYGTAASISYVVGVVAAFIALSVSQTAQPALLYLSPICCGTIWALAYFRGDLKHMLDGLETMSSRRLDGEPLLQE
eukprot:m.124014 g.124014  ORF g.124014 m.124014 type:complete len:523 (+) comp14462_c0_seq1:188-1756(+)